MSLSFPASLPTTPGIRSINWQARSSVARSESLFSFKGKSYDWGGKGRVATVELPPMTVAQAKPWVAFFLSLNGPQNTFLLGPTLDGTPSGSANGTPKVNGTLQSGESVVTDGWTGAQTGVLKAGDWIGIENRLYQLMEDEDADSNGDSILTIWPDLRSSPADNADIITANPKGVFRMQSIPAILFSAAQFVEGVVFQAIEEI